jgi:hypothetical protein
VHVVGFIIGINHKNRSERQRFNIRVGKMAVHVVSIPESPDPNPTFHTFHGLSRGKFRDLLKYVISTSATRISTDRRYVIYAVPTWAGSCEHAAYSCRTHVLLSLSPKSILSCPAIVASPEQRLPLHLARQQAPLLFIFNYSISGSDYMALNDVITSEEINWKNVKMICRRLICFFRHFHVDMQENHKNQKS